MVSVDPYVFWTFFASFLGFLVLCVLRLFNAGEKKKMTKKKNALFREEAITSDDGDSRPVVSGSGNDVLIVGAGVAGSALAYTLGKVIIFFMSIIYKDNDSFWVFVDFLFFLMFIFENGIFFRNI